MYNHSHHSLRVPWDLGSQQCFVHSNKEGLTQPDKLIVWLNETLLCRTYIKRTSSRQKQTLIINSFLCEKRVWVGEKKFFLDSWLTTEDWCLSRVWRGSRLWVKNKRNYCDMTRRVRWEIRGMQSSVVEKPALNQQPRVRISAFPVFSLRKFHLKIYDLFIFSRNIDLMLLCQLAALHWTVDRGLMRLIEHI